MSAEIQGGRGDQTKLAVKIALNVIYGFIRNRSRNFANFQFIHKFTCESLNSCFF